MLIPSFRNGVRQKVVLFHTGRCGSTVLGNLLDQHPEIHWASEIFESYKKQYKRIASKPEKHQKLAAIITNKVARTKARIFGFETKYLPEQQLRPDYIDMKLEEYLRFIKALGFSKFIILQRRNYLRRAVSAMVALKTKQYQAYTPVDSLVTVALNPDLFLNGNIKMSLLEHFSRLDKWYSILVQMLSGDECLFLDYEDDILPDPLIAYAKVCEFFNVNLHPAKIINQQTNPFPLENIVENIGDISYCLAGTEYEWMLNE